MIYYEDGELVIRTAVESDIEPIAQAIRREDEKEVLSEGCESVHSALAESFANSSLCLTLERKGVPLALLGIVPDSLCGSSARVWLLGSQGLDKIKKSFMRLSRSVVAMFLLRYPILWNRVDLRYQKTVRWMLWLGAEGGRVDLLDNGQVPFQTFVLRGA